MGTTTRRTPITHSIPSSPNYRFQNLTNFKGINVTENPFNVDDSSASDMKNLYINEENVLTTRPRLEMKINLKEIINVDNLTILYVYKLNNGYLVHGKVNDDYKMYVVEPTTDNNYTSSEIVGEIPYSECNIFEKDNVIYVLSGSKYLQIKKGTYTLDFVEPYIPTRSVGEEQVERLNILTDKYKEEYYWDGIEALPEITSNTIDFNNKHLVEKFKDELKDYQLLAFYEHEELSGLDNVLLLCSETDSNYNFGPIYVGKIDNNFESIEITKLNIEYLNNDSERYTFKACKNSSILIRYLIPSISVINNIDFIKINCLDNTFSINSINSIYTKTNNNGGVTSQNISYIKDDNDSRQIVDVNILSNNGEYLQLKHFNNSSLARLLVYYNGDKLYTIRSNNESFEEIGLGYEQLFTNDLINTNYNCIVNKLEGAANSPYSVLYKCKITEDLLESVETLTSLNSTCNIKFITDDNLKVLIHDSIYKLLDFNGYLISSSKLPNILYMNINHYVTKFTRLINNKETVIEEYKNYGYFKDYQHNIYLIPNLEELNTYYIFKNNSKDYTNGTKSTEKNKFYISLKKYLISNDFILGDYYGNYINNLEIFKYEDNKDKNFVELTKQLTEDDIEYKTWKERNESFNQSFIYGRFDNNFWFAHNNEIFRTMYNNPTYIPIDEYNSLGDSNDIITGLNSVDDNLLVVYKEEGIYLVQSYTDNNNETQYSYTEAKNTLGNHGYNAVISTALNELPIQINYNGIYSLNQLENVESSSRVVKIINEQINPLWLKEDKDMVKKIKTFNHIYWTYFILRTEDKCKIYLLDNRSMEWFYWELEIDGCINCFVKDNKVIFIDEYGQVYTLEVEDVVISGDDVKISQYYDEVLTDKDSELTPTKKLINWYWKSQFLPLGTINYYKRLITTTFIFVDNNPVENEEMYGLEYSVDIYSKRNSKLSQTQYTGDITLLQSVTKRTMSPKCNFIQVKLSNIEDKSNFNHNKLKLVGIAFKYTLTEGMML